MMRSISAYDISPFVFINVTADLEFFSFIRHSFLRHFGPYSFFIFHSFLACDVYLSNCISDLGFLLVFQVGAFIWSILRLYFGSVQYRFLAFLFD